MKIKLLDLREEILQECKDTMTSNEKLVILSAGDDKASEIYMRNKIKTGEQLGIETIHIRCDSQAELLNNIMFYNHDNSTSGIIVQLPLPKEYNEKVFINLINPDKDVDMLTDSNKAKIALGTSLGVFPATTTGCLKVLNKHFNSLVGLDVLLIGRSDLCNIPLQRVLSDMNCTVTLAHSKTKDLDSKIRNSDIIITATGTPNLITKNSINEKVKLILDVSINRVNGKLCGDVTEEVYDLTDVSANPNGIGCLTTACLFLNTIKMNKLHGGN